MTISCTAQAIDECPEMARLRARLEEPTPRIMLSKSEAMALLADHHALRQEVLRARSDIKKFLKQGAKFF